MMIRTGKYLFTLLLVLAQLTATTGYTAMIHYCRMAVLGPDAAPAECACAGHTAVEAEPAAACYHDGTDEVGAAEGCATEMGAADEGAADEGAAGCCTSEAGTANEGTANKTAGECASDRSAAEAGSARKGTVEASVAKAGAAPTGTDDARTAGLPQPGLDRTPCCEFVSHFHHVDETAPLAPSMPTLVPAFLMILPPPDRHIHHGSVPAFSSAPPDFQHTLPLLI